MWIDDQVLRQCDQPIAIATWVPQSPMVVLGSSNDPAREVEQTYCADARIPVLRRYGGGGTVVLYDGCVVISVGTWVKEHFQNAKYFRALNACVIAVLAKRWPKLSECVTSGISDIAISDHKIAGTSLFRSRNYLLYQASILIDLNVDLVTQCLKHPSKEPDYRRGRSHSEFLIGLRDLASDASPQDVVELMSRNLNGIMRDVLGDELVSPASEQFAGLLARAGTVTSIDHCRCHPTTGESSGRAERCPKQT